MSNQMENCIFCKIIKKEIPSHVLYEDEKTLVFLDIHPYNKGHSLIIPKKHSNNFFETEDDDLAHLVKICKKIGIALEKTLNADGLQIRVNTNEAGGQDVFHTHFHVIPKFLNDPKTNQHLKYSEGEKDELILKIKENI